MKKTFLTLIALFAATVGFAQPEPSVEMTVDTLSGCTPLTVHVTFKSISNTDTLTLYTGDGFVCKFANMADLAVPVPHTYQTAGRFIPVVVLTQWVMQKDSNGNDQKVKIQKQIISPDTIQVVRCQRKWFPKDAECIYILPSPSGPEVQPMEFKVVSDTLIQGRQCVATTFQFDPFSLANNIRTICFCEANDSVFFYNPKAKEFQMLYNFNLQKGDEYVIYPSPEQKDDSLVVYVDSVTSVTVDGASLRVQYVHTRSISHADRTNHWQIGWNDKAVIYETIGSLVYFMPQETGWNDMFFDHLCQYSGDGINFKKNSDESCETDGIIEPEKGTGAQLLVYPNPASEYIDVTLSERSAKEGEWLVCNALGEVVFRTAASGEKITRIPLHNLSKGFYFIQYRSGNIVRNGRFAIQ